MALLHITHKPDSIKMDMPLDILVPDPGAMGGVPVRQRKLLYLLHGLSDDSTAWVRFSSVEIIARQYGLVVAMPTVHRSFYADQPNGLGYWQYLSEELPQYLADVFALKPAREDTLVAGLSMGGYGAMKCALLHPERYAAAAAFSGALSLAIFQTHAGDERQAEFAHLFGDFSRLPGSQHDPAVWLANAVKHPAGLPRLYVSCGTADDLLPLNRLFAAQCAQLGVPLEYHEEEGAAHTWPFWDKEIGRFLRFALGEPPQ